MGRSQRPLAMKRSSTSANSLRSRAMSAPRSPSVRPRAILRSTASRRDNFDSHGNIGTASRCELTAFGSSDIVHLSYLRVANHEPWQ
jgi:hypothetical protein